MEAVTYLERAMQAEEMLIKVDGRLFIPGKMGSEGPHLISLDGIVFSLEECATVDELEGSFFSGETQAVDKIKQGIIKQKELSGYLDYSYYSSETNLLELIVKSFSRLKPEIGYADHLKIDKSRFFFPDREYIKPEFEGQELGEQTPIKVEDASISGIANGLLPRHCIFMNNGVYALVEKGEASERIKVSLGGKSRVVPEFAEPIAGFRTKYAQAIEESLERQIKSEGAEEVGRLEKMRRYRLLKTVEDEDFLSYGLLIQRPDETHEQAFNAIMVLPEMAIPIPKSSKYLRFAQAELKCQVKTDRRGQQFEASRIKYDASTTHPLVYTERDARYVSHDLVGCVCLRGAEQDVNDGHRYDRAEQLARLFLINRHMIMYGTNLTNDFALNPHYVGRGGFKEQRVDERYIQENNVLVVGR